MKNRKPILYLLGLAALALLIAYFHNRVHFNFRECAHQIRQASLKHIALGVALIYITYYLRAIRWSVFLSPTKKISPNKLVGSQFIGFTAVALFGRLADLTRPFILARRTGLPLSSQVAVYTIERMFDLGAAAIIFSTALLFLPKDSALPFHQTFVHVGQLSLAGTLFLALFAIAVRISGSVIASFARATIGRLSPPLGESFHTKIIDFRAGLNALSSFSDFLIALAISLTMWLFIALAYVQTAHAFTHTPELASLSFPATMLLLATSIGASLFQAPIIGWFTTIAATATAMHGFYNAPIEAATACAAVLLFVTFLCIIPTGLIFAKLEHVSLKPPSDAASDPTLP